MTGVEVVARMMCLASGIFGRPTWDESKCVERAVVIVAAAERHGVDPVLMVAIDVQECELADVDAPIVEQRGGRAVVVGFDACPMGVRIRGVAKRRGHDIASLYDLAASKLAWWRDWCGRGHPGHSHRWRSHSHYVAHYNWGNESYSHRILATARALEGRRVHGSRHLNERTRAFVNRLYVAQGLPWRLPARPGEQDGR